MNFSYYRVKFIIVMIIGICSCGPLNSQTVDELLSIVEGQTDSKIIYKLLKSTVRIIKQSNII